MPWLSIIFDFRGIIADFQAQRVNEKNGVICLVMLTPRVMVVKMSKMVYFLYFLLMADKLVTVWAKYSSDPKNLLEFIPKMVWSISFGVTVHEVLR